MATIRKRNTRQPPQKEENQISRPFLLFFAFLFCLTACAMIPRTMDARLYTEDGQVLPAHFTYAANYRGEVWGTLPDGEKFKGEYFTISNKRFDTGLLITPWGPITGISISKDNKMVTYITATGENGTLIQGVSIPQGAHGFGACRDSKGREYRLHY